MILPAPFAIIIMYTNVFLQCNIEDGIRAALNSIKQTQIEPINDIKSSQLSYILRERRYLNYIAAAVPEASPTKRWR